MNVVCLIGRLTRDPELQTTSTGMNVCRFTLAVDRRVRSQNGNGPTADFIGCKAFGKTAETIAQYLSKGRKFAVTGHIQTGSYDNQQGQRVYTTDVIVDNFTFIDSRGDSQNSYGGNQGGYSSQNPQGGQPGGYGNGQNFQDQNSYFGGGFNSQPAYNSYQSSGNSYSGGYQNSGNQPQSNGANDFDSSFDDADGLDIATDDLPF